MLTELDNSVKSLEFKRTVFFFISLKSTGLQYLDQYNINFISTDNLISPNKGQECLYMSCDSIQIGFLKANMGTEITSALKKALFFIL